MSQDELRLYTFAVSHFSEKIRWTLDASRIPYREITWTPSLHMARARLKTGKATTVPIVQIGREVVQDSTEILHFLASRYAPFALLPDAPALRREVLDIEEQFDEIGTQVVRYAYQTALESPKAVQAAWLARANALERALVPLLFPGIAPAFRKMFRIDPAHAARAADVIEKGATWLDARVEGGRRYLVGDRLTVADITAAALLAPLACPDEHPVYGTQTYRDAIAPAVRELGARPALRWVRDLYRRDRTASGAP
jgi:glutathione S-transferase